MTSYLVEHTRNIISKKPFSKGNLPFGSIITFNYMDEDKKPSKPMVLVLNPVWEGHLPTHREPSTSLRLRGTTPVVGSTRRLPCGTSEAEVGEGGGRVRPWCTLFGHKPLRLQALFGADLISVRDATGNLLVVVHLCERCHGVYWEVA